MGRALPILWSSISSLMCAFRNAGPFFQISSGIFARSISRFSLCGFVASPARRASYQSVQTSQSSLAARRADLRSPQACCVPGRFGAVHKGALTVAAANLFFQKCLHLRRLRIRKSDPLRNARRCKRRPAGSQTRAPPIRGDHRVRPNGPLWSRIRNFYVNRNRQFHCPTHVALLPLRVAVSLFGKDISQGPMQARRRGNTLGPAQLALCVLPPI